MDSKKKKSKSPFDIWPPPPKKKLTKGELRKEMLKPKNKSYVDRYLEMEAELNAPVFDIQDETQKEQEAEQSEREDTEKDEQYHK